MDFHRQARHLSIRSHSFSPLGHSGCRFATHKTSHHLQSHFSPTIRRMLGIYQKCQLGSVELRAKKERKKYKIQKHFIVITLLPLLMQYALQNNFAQRVILWMSCKAEWNLEAGSRDFIHQNYVNKTLERVARNYFYSSVSLHRRRCFAQKNKNYS